MPFRECLLALAGSINNFYNFKAVPANFIYFRAPSKSIQKMREHLKNAKLFYGGNGKVGNGKVGNGKVTPWVHTIHHIDTWLCRRDLHHGICIFLCREALPCSHTSEVPCLLLLPQVAMSRQASMYHHSESTHILLVVECSAGVEASSPNASLVEGPVGVLQQCSLYNPPKNLLIPILINNIGFIYTCEGGIFSIIFDPLQNSSCLSSFTEHIDVVLSYKIHVYRSSSSKTGDPS